MARNVILSIAIIIILIVSFRYAIDDQSESNLNNIKLLAVAENKESQIGATVDLSLEIRQGQGRVFIETFPLTKFDTQISTRFAKGVACDFLDIDCSNKDFIYNINAKSVIIGGPSAGGSVAVLTVAALAKLDIDKNTAMTGTINSGGLIGPVAGIKEKIDAAAAANIKKVIIPKGTKIYSVENSSVSNISAKNSSLTYNISLGDVDLVKYGLEKGVHVVEVGNLNDALYEFTGHRRYENHVTLTPNDEYTQTMNYLAQDMCNRTHILNVSISNLNNVTKQDAYNAGTSLYNESLRALEMQRYYAAASYCFGANVQFNYLSIKNNDANQIDFTKKTIKDFEAKVDSISIKTIADLQTYMVVKERLLEASRTINDATSYKEQNNSKYHYTLAYAIERLHSAYSWSHFFGSEGKEFNLNDKVLKKSCMDKISQAHERVNYVSFVYPQLLQSAQNQLDIASEYLQNGKYSLCLFQASKSKAEADAVISLFGVSQSQLEAITDNRLDVVKQTINKAISQGIFPILGYSYFEYAQDLKNSDIHSSLLYAEYALELSDFGSYFKQYQKERSSYDKKSTRVLLLGIFLGVLIGFTVFKRKKDRNRLFFV